MPSKHQVVGSIPAGHARSPQGLDHNQGKRREVLLGLGLPETQANLMQTSPSSRSVALSLLAVLSASALGAAETPATLQDAVQQGKVSLNVRARYEGVDQSGLKDASAITLRTQLGYTTAAFEGFTASVEFENIVSPDGDAYSQAGLNPGGTGRAVVADPTGSEVNQAWLAYTTGKSTLTLGRQNLVLDNARFIGNVAWRQNMQTFDGVTLKDKSFDKLSLNYGYLSRINRVFGDRHAQGNWDSDSHVFNAAYTGLPAGTLTGYVYLLDFKNAAANSCATYGLSFAGAKALDSDLKLNYRAELALQNDYGKSTLNYSSNYYSLELGLSHKLGGAALGYEVLGSDNNVGFKTPLATLHAFNGWADLFLSTPNTGLRDFYLKLNANLPSSFKLLAFYHEFHSDKGDTKLGDEVDVQLSRQFTKQLSALAKYSKFSRDLGSLPNVDKIWVELDYAF